MTVPFIYLVEGSGALVGPVAVPEIPGLGVQLPDGGIQLEQQLPEPEPGLAWGLIDGQARQLPDFRGTVYSVVDGSSIEYGLLGELPDGLTLLPRPTEDHAWTGSAWEFSPALQAQNRQVLASRLCGEVDAAADAVRRELAGDLLRALEYLRAAEAAQSFALAGYPPDQVPEYVAAGAVGGITPQQAADDILREAGYFNGALLKLRQVRLAAKVRVRELIQSGEIDQGKQVSLEAIDSILAVVSVGS